MKLHLLWETDLFKSYHLYQQFEADENGFINSAYGMNFNEFKDFVERRKNQSLGIDLPDGFVSDSVYILEDDGHYVGIFNFRHYVNEGLKNGAGHIGYGIAPIYRGHHYATKGLALLLKLTYSMIPEDRFYLSVAKYNTPSLKAQLNNHAIIDHEDDTHYYTYILKECL